MASNYQLDGLTYPRLNLKDNTLDENHLEERCPLDNGRITGCVQHGLGMLGCLPLEVIHLVLVGLDLRTLTVFRRVNWRALSTLDHLFEYRTLVTCSPNLLRGVLSIQSDRWVTCRTLYNALCTAECEGCGDIGGYIYILTGCRVCFLCLSQKLDYLPIPFGRASLLFDIPFNDLTRAPFLVGLPGIYSPNEKKYSKTQQRLIDFRALHRIVDRSSSHLGVEAWNKLYGKSHHIEHSRETHPQSAQQLKRSRILNICERSYDAQSGNALRFLAIVQAPSLDTASHTLKNGFFCTACKKSHVRRPMHFRRQFVESSFKKHLAQCHSETISNSFSP